jgi:hypothetical protein
VLDLASSRYQNHSFLRFIYERWSLLYFKTCFIKEAGGELNGVQSSHHNNRREEHLAPSQAGKRH